MIDINTTEHKGKKLTGKVVSCKMQKTAVVLVERKVKHETYGKYVRCSTKIHAHDESSLCKLGDVVTIGECRPISKTKRWTILPSKEKE